MLNRSLTMPLLLLLSALSFHAMADTPGDDGTLSSDISPELLLPAGDTQSSPYPPETSEEIAAIESTAVAETPDTAANPYGLAALWRQGDFIAKSTLMILFVMSMTTWYILLTKLWNQTLLNRYGKSMQKSFWQAGSLQEGIATLAIDNTYRGIVEDGLAAAEHHEGKLTDQIDLQTWISMSLKRSMETVSGQMQGGLAFLATVGSTAPFIGLFGTVWGIYHALISIGVAGQASIDKVAGPVGEALIMTAIGLAVAVPAVLGYNWLVRRNKLILEQVRNFSGIIEAHLLSGLHHSGRVHAVSNVRAAG